MSCDRRVTGSQEAAGRSPLPALSRRGSLNSPGGRPAHWPQSTPFPVSCWSHHSNRWGYPSPPAAGCPAAAPSATKLSLSSKLACHGLSRTVPLTLNSSLFPALSPLLQRPPATVLGSSYSCSKTQTKRSPLSGRLHQHPYLGHGQPSLYISISMPKDLRLPCRVSQTSSDWLPGPL